VYCVVCFVVLCCGVLCYAVGWSRGRGRGRGRGRDRGCGCKDIEPIVLKSGIIVQRPRLALTAAVERPAGPPEQDRDLLDDLLSSSGPSSDLRPSRHLEEISSVLPAHAFSSMESALDEYFGEQAHCDDLPQEHEGEHQVVGEHHAPPADLDIPFDEEPLVNEEMSTGDLEAETLPSLMLRLHIECRPLAAAARDLVCNGVVVARYNSIWGNTHKVTCKRHQQCSLMVETKWFGDVPSTLKTLYRWAAMGEEATAEEHRLESSRVSAEARARVKSAQAKKASALS
jgi:hypothetical protein